MQLIKCDYVIRLKVAVEDMHGFGADEWSSLQPSILKLYLIPLCAL